MCLFEPNYAARPSTGVVPRHGLSRRLTRRLWNAVVRGSVPTIRCFSTKRNEAARLAERSADVVPWP